MTEKKRHFKFSSSYVNSAKEAGVNNTYIPDAWKLFFLTAPSGAVVKKSANKKAAKKAVVKKAIKKAVFKKAAKKAAKKVAKR